MDYDPLSPDEVIRQLAEQSGVSAQQVQAVLQAQAELACKHIRRGYPLAGIGVVALLDFPGRKMLMRFGPDAGTEKVIPAKRKINFRVVQPLRDAVLGGAAMPDVSTVDWYPPDLGPAED